MVAVAAGQRWQRCQPPRLATFRDEKETAAVAAPAAVVGAQGALLLVTVVAGCIYLAENNSYHARIRLDPSHMGVAWVLLGAFLFYCLY